jgi:hypothetical protein
MKIFFLEADVNRYVSNVNEMVIYISQSASILNDPINGDDIRAAFNLNNEV